MPLSLEFFLYVIGALLWVGLTLVLVVWSIKRFKLQALGALFIASSLALVLPITTTTVHPVEFASLFTVSQYREQQALGVMSTPNLDELEQHFGIPPLVVQRKRFGFPLQATTLDRVNSAWIVVLKPYAALLNSLCASFLVAILFGGGFLIRKRWLAHSAHD